MYRKAIELGHAGAYFNLGVLLADQQRLEEAEQMFRKAIELGHAGAYYNLGVLLKNQQRLEEAEQMFHKRSEEHTSELQSRQYLVCRLLLEKKRRNRQKIESKT